ncbi:sensor histidine kinase [Aromatoleum diolicum]|uniref:histidine kinase n=1 Tax=Aromatoleum diolicum TaxID=75796 RepID=A0ABX1QIT8_9RHOO|nr:HAMP domain-containing sensor histidine kinase [Aromatoleum diolicum]NMG77446.1 two-component sensor histidine kinase [Aromatoleum diolicum]
MNSSPKPFNLRKWFSVVSLFVTGAVAIVFGAVLSNFFVSETIKRDAVLTMQFIQAIAEIEVRHGHFGHANVTLGQFLDKRVEAATLNVPEETLARVRQEFFDHLRTMPEALLATVFAPDGMIVWSTNPLLVGKVVPPDHEFGEVLISKYMVAGGHLKGTGGKKLEQQFVRYPQDIYIENYVPLLDRAGNVASVVEIYKEPSDLIHSIKRGYLLIWAAALASAAVVYLALRWIIIRAARLMEAQQRQIVENETLVAIGEMSSAVAHGLRNPLASIRSSAELALEIEDLPVAKNLKDIVTQVDRLSKWVRELLLYSRPISDDRENVQLAAAVDEALAAFDVQIRRAGIELDWSLAAQPPVLVCAHGALLAQVLNSVLSNAIEAMPQGGRLSVSIAPPEHGRVVLHVGDTGIGMSEKQLALAFKPFQTTKRSGLGVGLAMMKRIMERFGGAVTLDSREKVGTTVRLIFKLA